MEKKKEIPIAISASITAVIAALIGGIIMMPPVWQYFLTSVTNVCASGDNNCLSKYSVLYICILIVLWGISLFFLLVFPFLKFWKKRKPNANTIKSGSKKENKGVVITNTKIEDDNFIVYEGLTLEEDNTESGFSKALHIGSGLENEFRLSVTIHNADRYIYDCQIVLDNLEFHGSDRNAQWEDSYRGFDRKAMKWDVGYIPNEGKIEVENNSKKPLEIARAITNSSMQLSYLDGYSRKKYNLNGKYRATLIIYGKVLVNSVKRPIKDLLYKVTFQYDFGSILRIIEIEKLQ